MCAWRDASKSVILVGLFSLATPGVAAQPTVKLSPKTVKAFDSYVRNWEQRLEERRSRKNPFLWVDDRKGGRDGLRNGDVLIENESPSPIEGGLLHVWRGAMFVQNVTGASVLEVLQAYDRHKDWYPEVIESRLLSRRGDTLVGYHRLLKKQVLTAVLDTENEASYHQLGPGRWAGRSISTRIVEVKNAGERGERTLPVGEDSGFLWRLYVYWQIEEADEGVFVECQTISLSRSVPFGLGWLIKPFVTSIPRESLLGTLEATRRAATDRERARVLSALSQTPGSGR